MDIAIQTKQTPHDEFMDHLRRAMATRTAHRIQYLTMDSIHARLAQFANNWRNLTSDDLATIQLDMAAMLIDICEILEVPMEGILTNAEIQASMNIVLDSCKSRRNE